MEPEAGPSRHTASINDQQCAGAGFLPVPGLSEGERIPRSSLSGTQDLLGAFDLIGLYNQLVKPYAKSNASSKTGLQSDIKGKGKAVDPGPTQQPEPDGETPGTAKKLPRGYLHHVADLPGTYNSQKDRYLKELCQNPDYQPTSMQPMDDHTLRAAFTLQEGITPEVDAFMGIYPKKAKKSKRKRDQPGTAPPPGGLASSTAAQSATPQAAGGTASSDVVAAQDRAKKKVRIGE